MLQEAMQKLSADTSTPQPPAHHLGAASMLDRSAEATAGTGDTVAGAAETTSTFLIFLS